MTDQVSSPTTVTAAEAEAALRDIYTIIEHEALPFGKGPSGKMAASFQLAYDALRKERSTEYLRAAIEAASGALDSARRTISVGHPVRDEIEAAERHIALALKCAKVAGPK